MANKIEFYKIRLKGEKKGSKRVGVVERKKVSTTCSHFFLFVKKSKKPTDSSRLVVFLSIVLGDGDGGGGDVKGRRVLCN